MSLSSESWLYLSNSGGRAHLLKSNKNREIWVVEMPSGEDMRGCKKVIEVRKRENNDLHNEVNLKAAKTV